MMAEWMTRLLDTLPTFLAALALLFVGGGIAWLVREGSRRLLSRLGIDALVERSGLTESLQQAQITRNISDIIAQLLFWLIFLIFILAALEMMGLQTAVVLLERLVGYFPQLLAAILLLIVGAWLSQIAGRLVQVTTDRLGIDFHRQLGQTVRGLLLVMAVIIAIEQLGFDVTFLTDTLTNLLTIILAGLALAFGLGAREISRNALAGYYARELFKLGERLALGEIEGILEAIGTLNSELETGEGRLIVPNSWLIEKGVLIIEDGESKD